MDIRLGDVFFIPFHDGDEVLHPCVVYEIRGDEEMSVCMISTNMKKAYWPGNILLDVNEAGLEKRSIVIISKTRKVKHSAEMKYVGRFGKKRMEEIISGIGQLEKK